MICFTNADRLGGDPKLQNDLKKLIDITRRLFVQAISDNGPKPYIELEKEFTALVSPSRKL